MTHKQRVLELLRDGKPHGHMEGYRLGVMLHSRVADLRRDGHVIECWSEGRGNYFYRLLSAAESSGQTAGSPVSGALNKPQEVGGDNQLALSIPRSAYEEVAA